MWSGLTSRNAWENTGAMGASEFTRSSSAPAAAAAAWVDSESDSEETLKPIDLADTPPDAPAAAQVDSESDSDGGEPPTTIIPPALAEGLADTPEEALVYIDGKRGKATGDMTDMSYSDWLEGLSLTHGQSLVEYGLDEDLDLKQLAAAVTPRDLQDILDSLDRVDAGERVQTAAAALRWAALRARILNLHKAIFRRVTEEQEESGDIISTTSKTKTKTNTTEILAGWMGELKIDLGEAIKGLAKNICITYLQDRDLSFLHEKKPWEELMDMLKEIMLGENDELMEILDLFMELFNDPIKLKEVWDSDELSVVLPALGGMDGGLAIKARPPVGISELLTEMGITRRCVVKLVAAKEFIASMKVNSIVLGNSEGNVAGGIRDLQIFLCAMLSNEGDGRGKFPAKQALKATFMGWTTLNQASNLWNTIIRKTMEKVVAKIFLPRSKRVRAIRQKTKNKRIRSVNGINTVVIEEIVKSRIANLSAISLAKLSPNFSLSNISLKKFALFFLKKLIATAEVIMDEVPLISQICEWIRNQFSKVGEFYKGIKELYDEYRMRQLEDAASPLGKYIVQRNTGVRKTASKTEKKAKRREQSRTMEAGMIFVVTDIKYDGEVRFLKGVCQAPELERDDGSGLLTGYVREYKDGQAKLLKDMRYEEDEMEFGIGGGVKRINHKKMTKKRTRKKNTKRRIINKRNKRINKRSKRINKRSKRINKRSKIKIR